MDFLSLIKRWRPNAPARFGVGPRRDTSYIYWKKFKMQEIQQKKENSQPITYTWEWNERLDKRLSSNLPYSRNFFEHIIKSKRIYIQTQHGKKIVPKKSYKLQPSDSIYIESLERFTDGGILEEAAYIQCKKIYEKESSFRMSETNEESREDQPSQDCHVVPPRNDEWWSSHTPHQSYIPIVHETPDYMVIYKPKWVLSHPNSVRDLSTPSVVASIYQYIRNCASSDHSQQNNLPSSWSFIRAGLVHRLDKETDGYMIIAKTEAWLAYFKNLFMQKSWAETIAAKEAVPLRKRYRAISQVYSKWRAFISSIAADLPHIHTADVIPNTPNPSIKTWITKFLHIEPCTDPEIQHLYGAWEYIYVDIEILTGRTHQIRYHLSSVWLPILWDYLYHPAYVKADSRVQPMCLSAVYLWFTDMGGQQHEFQM